MEIKPQGTEQVVFEDLSLIKKELKASRRLWTWVFAILVFAEHFVPYTALTNIPRIYGSFLFWWVTMVLIIAGVFVTTSKWRD